MKEYPYKYKISRDSLFSPLQYGEHLLYQVGRIHCNADSEIPIHAQRDYFELTIATEGKGTVITNNEPVEVSAGDIYISFAGDFHRIISDRDHPLKFDFITIKSRNEAISECMEKIIEQNHAADRRVVRDEVILQVVSRIISEAKKSKKLSEKMIEALISEIFVLLIRDFDVSDQDDGAASKTEAEMLCFRLMNYIDNHIYSIRNLRELAETTNYSYNYLSNLFKDITGTTLQGYYHNRRLETARLLLASEDFTVSEIAGMLGYSSVYPFSLAFKKRFGFPPSAAKRDK